MTRTLDRCQKVLRCMGKLDTNLLAVKLQLRCTGAKDVINLKNQINRLITAHHGFD